MKVIVTGSTKGLGYALAHYLVKEGHDVAISSRHENAVQEALQKLQDVNPSVKLTGTAIDYSNSKDVHDYVQGVLSSWGHVDLIINNVGIYGEDSADEDIQESLEKMLSVNLMASVRCNTAVIPSMKSRKSGMIVHVISIAAKNMRADAASYSISKVALMAYNDLLRDSLKEYGIKVMALYPGAMNTSSWDETSADRNNMIQMEDMAKTVLTSLELSDNATFDEIVINNLKEV